MKRRDFIGRLFKLTVVVPCASCAQLSVVPGTREGAPPLGTGCCKQKHCRYYQGPRDGDPGQG